MRIIVIPLALLVLAAPAAAQRKVEQRSAAAHAGPVRIHNMIGSVRITGWDKDTIAVTGTVNETKQESFGFWAGPEGAKLGFWDATGKELKPSHFEVRVPAGSSVWVKSASSDVIISGVTGGIDVYSVSGRVEINGAPREVMAESLGGAVVVNVSTRSARVKSASGSIELRGKIADATATSVSGPVTVEGSLIERGRFESVDGNIRWLGEIGRASVLDFTNHAGAVEFVMPRTVSADFLVNTYEGAFDDKFGVRASYGGTQLKGKEIRFKIGDPQLGANVTVRNFKGAVVLRVRT